MFPELRARRPPAHVRWRGRLPSAPYLTPADAGGPGNNVPGKASVAFQKLPEGGFEGLCTPELVSTVPRAVWCAGVVAPARSGAPGYPAIRRHVLSTSYRVTRTHKHTRVFIHDHLYTRVHDARLRPC